MTAAETSIATDFEIVIGLEVHSQLLTKSKMFCSCSTDYAYAAPNTHVCPVCMGMPGVLPVINQAAVNYTIMTALALNCTIPAYSKFDRKNYPYPDLMKGYQISQYDIPLSKDGYLTIEHDGQARRVGITRVHLEEDTARLLHRDGYSLIDVNRSGTPLMEIVSEPDMRSSDEAYAYLSEVKQVLQFVEVSTCDMEKGHLRCDANVSVRPRGEKKFGTKTEVKNVNSFRFIREALEYEIERQVELIESGGKVTQETRLYNSVEGKTYGMRSKEQAHDYRYFPEPDLLPLVVDEKWRGEIRATLPELPEARRKRLIADYGISAQDAHVLTLTKSMANQFESAAKAAKSPKRVANLVQSELMGRLKARGLEIEQSPVSMKGLAEAADLVESGAISGKMLKDLFDLCFERMKDFPDVYEEEGRPAQSRDTSAIAKILDEVIAANPKQVEQYRAGKKTVAQFFVGKVMALSKGQANPQLVNELVTKKLG